MGEFSSRFVKLGQGELQSEILIIIISAVLQIEVSRATAFTDYLNHTFCKRPKSDFCRTCANRSVTSSIAPASTRDRQ